MYMNNKKLMEVSESIVKEFAPQILEALGLDNSDRIIERIKVSDVVGENIPNGICEVKTIVTKRFGMVINSMYLPDDETSGITLYPFMALHYRTKKGGIKQVPFFMRVFAKQLRRVLLFTLAHELRHYWQYKTGEMDKNETMFNGRSLMPYEHRWCERDANEFAYKFVQSLNGKY